MRIHWTPNPLRTVVELDDSDRWWLRECLQADHDSETPEWLSSVYDSLVDSLSDTHDGDCACVPSRCLKCMAEEYLEICTRYGLSKYMAYKIADAFGRDNEHTLDEAIDQLANYNPEFTWGRNRELWESCLPRWREEARQAHAWLVRYRDEHFAAQVIT